MSRIAAVALTVVTLLTGCTYTTQFNRSHFAGPPVPEDERVDGRVLVITSPADDSYVYTGHPSSLTGGGTNLTLPLGEITREAAVTAFGDLFRGGAERSSRIDGLESYRAVVAPRALSFDYEYNALRNLGFAVTPEANVSVSVTLLDERGTSIWQRTYDSGKRSGGTYLVSASPGDRIAKAAHEAVFELMRRAAADVKAVLASRPEAGPPAETANPAAAPSASPAPAVAASVAATEAPGSPGSSASAGASRPPPAAAGEPAQYIPRPQDHPALPPPAPAASPLPTRPPGTRDSWYIGFGLGGGAGRIKYGGRTLSFSEFLGGGADTLALNLVRVGATVTPKLLLGVDVGAIGARRSGDGVQLNYYDLGVMFFPMEKGLFIRGAAGLSALTIDATSSPHVTGKGTLRGQNVLLGLGYAFWMRRSFNLTLNIDYQAHFLNKELPSLYGGERVSLDSGSGVSGWIGFDWY
jgi:hypothetical protein